ncbi:hypothetical protein XH89_11190 [Bradyrhizobium sp. CCBAU 53340]|uniref:sulfotransferase domain-containing protein n=1 Tax=Bradyrhizobium sp. CCBAU 53340 TaxID=1325112 RepID=UPI00188C2601|nr:sulfotransferase domain-containing protein [Bradyrhizobium sp. CCBAU 53340]QOZ43988.1 hypothetical protein XH89_11190 [Bradyrhizobium sp. CCBAU 53340]
MIIWLASYPRSGNTALRTILFKAFGVHTYSLYDDKSAIGSRPALRAAVGHISHGLDQEEFYARATSDEKLYFVKTHDAPRDKAKAMYVVRDGRASAVSYFHYLKNFARQHNAHPSLTDVMRGRCPYGSWSEHFEAWAPTQRPDTLLINYSDIVAAPGQVVASVAKFTGLDVVSQDIPSFEELRKADAEFFRSGSDKNNIAEMQATEAALFWSLHGDLMKRLGYVDVSPAPL